MSHSEQTKAAESPVTITDFEKTALEFVNSVDDDQDLQLMQRFCTYATQLDPESFSKMMKHVQKSIDGKSKPQSKSKSKSKQIGEGKTQKGEKSKIQKDSNVRKGTRKRKTKKVDRK